MNMGCFISQYTLFYIISSCIRCTNSLKLSSLCERAKHANDATFVRCVQLLKSSKTCFPTNQIRVFFFFNLISANGNTLKLITFSTSDTNIYVVLFAEKTAVVDVLLAAGCFYFSCSSPAIDEPDPSI